MANYVHCELKVEMLKTKTKGKKAISYGDIGDTCSFKGLPQHLARHRKRMHPEYWAKNGTPPSRGSKKRIEKEKEGKGRKKLSRKDIIVSAQRVKALALLTSGAGPDELSDTILTAVVAFIEWGKGRDAEARESDRQLKEERAKNERLFGLVDSIKRESNITKMKS